MKLREYTDEQIDKYGNDFNIDVIREANIDFKEWYDHKKYLWKKPTKDLPCQICYEWRRFPKGQRHFGYAWWRICSKECTCSHHKEEVWMA